MDNHIFVKEMINDNVTNEAFTFSFLREQYRASSFDVNRFAIAACSELADHDQYEHELFFDMDINLPNIRWRDSPPQNPRSTLSVHQDYIHGGSALENIMGSSYEGQEFEFNIAFSDNGTRHDGMMGALSPADDLFYKGQLLPLHLPRRLRMVERLSSLDSTNLEEDEEDGFSAAAPEDRTKDSGHIPTVAELISREWHPAYPNYKSCHVIGSEDKARRANLAMVRSTRPCIDVREDEHDSNVFPGCYKDPALQMFNHGNARYRHAAMSPPRGCSRSSMGWKVLLPSSRRLSCQDFALWEDSYHGLDLRRSTKEAKKRGSFSMLRLRAPASFFKSFFASRGGLLVHQKDNHRHYVGTAAPLSTGVVDDEEDEQDGRGHLNASYHATVSDGHAGCSASFMLSKTLTLNSREDHERDRILKKARECLQKLFKSMYVLLSHTHHDQQSRNLLGSTSSSMDGMSTCSSTLSSSSSSRCRNGDSNITEFINEPVVQMKNAGLMESSRTASFSKRRRRSSDSRSSNHGGTAGMISTARCLDEGPRATIAILRNSSCEVSSSCLVHEVENPIQGAIAHCKQSSALPS